jgi:hypothetical protein
VVPTIWEEALYPTATAEAGTIPVLNVAALTNEDILYRLLEVIETIQCVLRDVTALSAI